MKLIGLAGAKGSGKTTIAKEIAVAHGKLAYVQSFAAPIKRMINMLLISAHVTDPDYYTRGDGKEFKLGSMGGVTTRHMMQTLGTEWGRNMVHPDLWCNIMREDLPFLQRGKMEIVVIDDVRFQNEVDMVTSMGGVVFEIIRPDGPQHDDNHRSEAGVTGATRITVGEGQVPLVALDILERIKQL